MFADTWIADAMTFAEKFGWPGLFVAVILLAIVWAARRYAPKVDAAFDAHQAFVNQTAQNNDRATKALEVLADSTLAGKTHQGVSHLVDAALWHATRDRGNEFSAEVKESLKSAKEALE